MIISLFISHRVSRGWNFRFAGHFRTKPDILPRFLVREVTASRGGVPHRFHGREWLRGLGTGKCQDWGAFDARAQMCNGATEVRGRGIKGGLITMKRSCPRTQGNRILIFESTLIYQHFHPESLTHNCSDLVRRIGRKPLESCQLERQQRGFVSDFRPSNPRIPSSLNSYSYPSS